MQNSLKDSIKAAGLTQTKLANSLGVHQTLVSQWINGKSKPSIKLIPKLAAAVGLPETEVLHYFI